MSFMRSVSKHTLRTTALLSALAIPAWAQLAGAYTIDNTAPTGGTNYNTFADAATALTTSGVSAPVVFDVMNGVGTYAGFAIAANIVGTSAANRVTFQAGPGQTPTISGPFGANVQTIKLGTANTANTGPKYITLKSLTVQGAAAGAAILAAGGDSIIVSGCIARNSGAGIAFTQTPNSIIEDCEVYGVNMTPGTPGLATYAGGIALTDRADFCSVRRNRVHDCLGNGIFLGGGGSATAQVRDNVVVNNAVWNCPGASTYPGGISLRRVTNSTVSFNSVSMPVGSANPGLSIGATTGAYVPPVAAAAEVSNNVVHHAGSGPCVFFDVTTAVVPTVFDYNLYSVAGTGPVGRVAAVLYPTIASWQALGAPSLAGKEVNSLAAAADFNNPAADLHILPTSAALLSGVPSLVPTTDDIDLQARGPIPCRGCDEIAPPPLYAAFAIPAVTTKAAGFGPFAYTITFVDQSQSTAGGGITSWTWDFNGDNIPDSNSQFPAPYTYTTPGNYTVSLTVTDAVNGSATLVRTNLVHVLPYQFKMLTAGAGVGDLYISPIPNSQNPTATMGFMFLSFATASPVGTGGLFGLQPDATSWNILLSQPVAGDLLHWIVLPGLFPNVPFAVPPGALSFLNGVTVDGVQVDISATYTVVASSGIARITF